jgi:hypothetical protein
VTPIERERRLRNAARGALVGLATAGAAALTALACAMLLSGLCGLAGAQAVGPVGAIAGLVGGALVAVVVAAASLEQPGWRGILRVAFVLAFGAMAGAGTVATQVATSAAAGLPSSTTGALLAALGAVSLGGAVVLGPHRPAPRSRGPAHRRDPA